MPASQLATSVRTKFPGVYDDLTDEQLEQKVLAKYPGYRDLVSPPHDTKPSTGSQLLRGGIATLPVMGGVLGGIAGSEVPVFGNAVGAGAGAALGEGLRQLIAQYAFGDKPSPGGQMITGLTAGGETAALNGLSSIVSGPGVRAAAGKLAEDIPVVRKFSPAIKAYQKAAAAESGGSGVPPPSGATRMSGRATGAPTPPEAPQGAPNPAGGVATAQERDAFRQAAQRMNRASNAPYGNGNVINSGVGPTEPELPPGARAATPATGKAAKLDDTSSGADQLGELLDATHGGEAPTVGNGSLKSNLADEIATLRRKYGADRIGKIINPDAPEAAVGSVLKTAPGASAMPDIAQEALLRDLKAGSTQSPSKTLRALSQLLKEYKRNGGPASSSVAKDLHELMKSHGFDVGGE